MIFGTPHPAATSLRNRGAVLLAVGVLSAGLAGSGQEIFSPQPPKYTGYVPTTGHLENLGVPLKKGGFRNACVCPDATGEKDLIYFNFSQEAGPLFMVSVDPQTGETHQYSAEAGHPGAHGFCCGPDRKIYFGTWDSGSLLVFDPKQPEKNIQTLGKPAPSESYIWQLVRGIDSRIWGVTYPNAKLVSFDTATGEMKDCGQASATEMYSQAVAVGPDGCVYTTFGTRKSDLIMYDPKTGNRRSIAPPDFAGHIASAWVGKCVDGMISAGLAPVGGPPGKDNRIWFEVRGARLIPMDHANTWVRPVFRDGRVLQESGDGTYGILDPRTNTYERGRFTYEAAGKQIFMVSAGPDGKIYGSGAMPMDLFRYDPTARRSEILGTLGSGEVYSMLSYGGKLYSFCYAPGDTVVYDPTKPWKMGSAAESNPRDLGPLGDGHCRPEGSLIGPDDLFFICSHAPYGELGGAMAIFDPRQQKVVANFRNLVQNQSLVCLAWEQQSNLIFGGSGIWGGGGSQPVAKEAHLFAFDPVKRKKLYEATPMPRDDGIKVLAAAAGKVFGVGNRSNKTFVFDPLTRTVIRILDNPFGSQIWGSYRLGKDGLIWGLTTSGVFTLDPKTYEYRLIVRANKPISGGMATTDDALYFVSGAELWRYRF